MDSRDIGEISDWHTWPDPAIKKAPNLPGVYVFRLAGRPFGRLQGQSDVIYVGTTAKKGKSTVRSRLKQHSGQQDRRHWLQRVPSQISPLEVAWIVCQERHEALLRESNLLREYMEDHIELPPGNRQQSAKTFQNARYFLSELSLEERRNLFQEVLSKLSAEQRKAVLEANREG